MKNAVNVQRSSFIVSNKISTFSIRDDVKTILMIFQLLPTKGTSLPSPLPLHIHSIYLSPVQRFLAIIYANSLRIRFEFARLQTRILLNFFAFLSRISWKTVKSSREKAMFFAVFIWAVREILSQIQGRVIEIAE